MLKRLWNHMTLLGVHPGLKDSEKIKILLLNQINFVTFVGLILLLILRFIISDPDFHRTIITLIIVGTPFYLNHKRYYNAARAFTCFTFPFWVSIGTVIYGSALGESSVMLISIFVNLILYDRQPRMKFLSVGFTVLLGIFLFLYSNQYSSGQAQTARPIAQTLIFLGATTIAIFVIHFYQLNIRNNEEQKQTLLKRLELKNEELERFAYITSHDLKEPVRNIGGFGGLLRRKLSKMENQTENIELVKEIEAASMRMYEMIESILKFSKLDQETLIMEPINLNSIVEQFERNHSQLLEDKAVKIIYKDLPSIFGNHIFLNLLFQNLIENAIKYNKSAIPTIKIDTDLDHENVQIRISDNGIGIEKEYSDYIFEPFRRLHNRGQYEGNGLGLAICKKIVTNHNGKIWLESKIGEGATFHISLPRKQHNGV